jgi:hypothetical protein
VTLKWQFREGRRTPDRAPEMARNGRQMPIAQELRGFTGLDAIGKIPKHIVISFYLVVLIYNQHV